MARSDGTRRVPRHASISCLVRSAADHRLAEVAYLLVQFLIGKRTLEAADGVLDEHVQRAPVRAWSMVTST